MQINHRNRSSFELVHFKMNFKLSKIFFLNTEFFENSENRIFLMNPCSPNDMSYNDVSDNF